jgi:O-antigen/teichoic acid export membrane protein
MTPPAASAPPTAPLVSGGIWAFAGKVYGSVIAIIINAILARLLTPDELGAYLLLFSVATVAALLAQFGLPQAMVRMIAQSGGVNDWGRSRSVITAGFVQGTLSAAVVAAAIALFGDSLLVPFPRFRHLSPLFPLASCWIVVLAWQAILSAAFKGLKDIRKSVIFGGTATTVIFFLLLLVIWLLAPHATLKAVVFAHLAAAGVAVLAGGVLVRRDVTMLPSQGHLRRLELVEASWPLLVVALTSAVCSEFDIWMVGLFGSPRDVAVYGAASRLARTIPFFLTMTNTVMSPVIAELAVQGKKAELERLLKNAALLSFLPVILPLLCFLTCGGPILGVVFGSYYRGGSGLLATLSVGTAFSVWTGACGLTLMMTGHQRALMKITVSCSVLTVAASALLSARIGSAGVALATSAGLILQNVLMLLMVRRKTGIWTHASWSLPEPGAVRLLTGLGRP